MTPTLLSDVRSGSFDPPPAIPARPSDAGRTGALRAAVGLALCSWVAAAPVRAGDSEVARVAEQIEETLRRGARSVRARVMVLGTFHFAGSASDERGGGSTGMLEPERQRQIAEVVRRLKAFAPTRVTLEVSADDREWLDERYAAWLRDDLELGENEVFQLGFRVARELGHEAVFGVDVAGRWLEPYVDPDAWARAHGQAHWLDDPATGGYLQALEILGRHREEQTLARHLALCNTPQVLSLFAAEYLHQKLALGDDEAYPAADGFATQWYNRHLRLYANLLRVRRDANERILLVIGNAHAAILRHLLADSVHFDPVSPVPFLAGDEAAHPGPLEPLLRSNLFELEHADGRLGGSGLDFLCRAAERAMFFVIGEPHNTRELPGLTLSLFEELAARHGFDRIGLEQGPLVVDRLQRAGRAGGRDAVVEAARRDPEALHFDGDAELAFLASAGQRPGVEGPLWGLDRILGLGHVLDWLSASPDGERLAPAIEALRREAEALDAAGDSLLEAHPEAVVELALEAATRAQDPDVRATAERWAESVENIRVFRAGGRESATTHREELLKSALRSRVDELARRSGEVPRVLLRFGHLHARRSGTQGTTTPLGAEAVEIAREHGLETFHLAVQLVNRPGVWWSLTDYPEYAPLARLGDPDRWLVVDLRPARERVAADPTLSVEVRELVRDFDALLLLGGGTRDAPTWR